MYNKVQIAAFLLTLAAQSLLANPDFAWSGTVSVQDANGDGLIDYWTYSKVLYDRQGEETQVLDTTYDANRNVVSTDQTTFEYNSHGTLQLFIVEGDTNADGIIDWRYSASYFYLPNNETEEVDSGFGEGYAFLDTFISDALSRPLSLVFDYTNADSIQLQEITWTYDDANNRYTEVTKSDTISMAADSTSIECLSVTLDAFGEPTLTVDVLEFTFEGYTYMWTNRTSYSYTRNSLGKIVFSLVETDQGADGTVDSYSTTTNTWDSNGDLLCSLTTGFGADGAVDSLAKTTHTWNGARALTSSTSEYNTQWGISETNSSTFGYDKWGDLTQRTNDYTSVLQGNRSHSTETDSFSYEPWRKMVRNPRAEVPKANASPWVQRGALAGDPLSPIQHRFRGGWASGRTSGNDALITAGPGARLGDGFP